MIEDGLLPKSVGRDVKKVDGRAAALLIFAVAEANTAADASAIANEFSSLKVYYSNWCEDPDLKNRNDMKRHETQRLYGISDKRYFIDALSAFINRESLLFHGVEITRMKDGVAGAMLEFYYRDIHNAIQTRTVQFWNEESDSKTSRIFRLEPTALQEISLLMTAPYLPRDNSDFEAYCADKILSDEIPIRPDSTPLEDMERTPGGWGSADDGGGDG